MGFTLIFFYSFKERLLKTLIFQLAKIDWI